LNEGKNAKIDQRQRARAEKLHEAGLLMARSLSLMNFDDM
jgi:hypothetical protein